MSSVFCTSCGGNTPYANGKKPKFCSNCSSDLNSLAAFTTPTQASIPPKKIVARVKPQPVQFEEEEEEDFEQPAQKVEFDKSDIEVTDMPRRRKVSIGDIMKTATPGEDFSRQDMKTSVERRSKEEIKAQYEREAGRGAVKPIEID